MKTLYCLLQTFNLDIKKTQVYLKEIFQNFLKRLYTAYIQVPRNSSYRVHVPSWKIVKIDRMPVAQSFYTYTY